MSSGARDPDLRVAEGPRSLWAAGPALLKPRSARLPTSGLSPLPSCFLCCCCSLAACACLLACCLSSLHLLRQLLRRSRSLARSFARSARLVAQLLCLCTFELVLLEVLGFGLALVVAVAWRRHASTTARERERRCSLAFAPRSLLRDRVLDVDDSRPRVSC